MTRAISLWIVFAIFFAAGVLVFHKANATPQRLHIAKQYIGLKEGTKRANRAMGMDTRIPWCGQFAYVVAKRAGTPIPKSHKRAVSWKRAGKRVKRSQARPGDYLVIRTKRSHHVTIYSRRTKGRMCGVGGNQSNRVKETCYRTGSVVAVVR